LVSEEDQWLHTSLLPCDDPDIERMIEALRQIGCDVFGDNGMPEVSFLRSREYEPSDLNPCEYVAKPRVSHGLGTAIVAGWCDSKGMLRLDGKLTPQARDFGLAGCSFASLLVARRGALRAFQESGLRGLQLVQPEIIAKRKIEDDERVHAIWSDIVMPPALNLYADLDRVISGRYEDMVKRGIRGQLFEGYFIGPELHYSRASIHPLGGFDLALVKEKQFIARECPGVLIVSQRFRSFVKETFGLEVTGVPVRIQEDEMIPWEGPYPGPLAHKNRRPKWLEKGLFSPENQTFTPS
jgi:hypothetical protein